jgi:protein SCO1/2
LASACGGRGRTGELRGTLLQTPLPKPDFVLTATDETPFDFRRETEGTVTLLFFGFTNCPDVCPVHMANLGAVLRKSLPEVARRVRVVFVTTDPEHDTPARLRAWLDRFSPGFVGLTGPIDSVNAIQARLNLPRAVQVPTADGYTIGHAAHVIAFTADDSAHVVYPFGTRQEDWAHDLPQLVSGQWSRPR